MTFINENGWQVNMFYYSNGWWFKQEIEHVPVWRRMWIDCPLPIVSCLQHTKSIVMGFEAPLSKYEALSLTAPGVSKNAWLGVELFCWK